MRQLFALIFLVLIAALGACAVMARRSRRAIGRAVARLLLALMPPVVGNLILVVSHEKLVSTVGCYIYFLGMDLVVYALLRFTFIYCRIRRPHWAVRAFVYLILTADAIQLLCNPFFHHAFSMEKIIVDDAPYFRLLPYAGQTFHRVVGYGIFAAVVVIFIVKLVRSSRIYSARYSAILFTLVVAGVWQTFYIFSRTPVDRSMVGFGVFGLLVFYFSLCYRSMRLLDRMLASIASGMQEALFFFDTMGRCIWANTPGKKLTGTRNDDFEQAAAQLGEMFGDVGQESGEWSSRRVLGSGDDARYFALERHTVEDKRHRMAGSFLSIRDTTVEEKALSQERYAASHDALTGLYTREHLYERIRETIAAHPDGHYMVAFVDVKDFKIVNDIFGSAFGDFALKRIADWIRSNMSENCVYGRLAGDTFGVCRPVSEFDPEMIEEELARFSVTDGSVVHHILIHLGVYEIAESDLDVSVMFDRAHLALSTIKDEYKTHIAYYDDAMRKKVLWSQHISTQLHDALAQRQIRPYLQPIVDGEGRVVGAEALVRWIHPTDGFLSPAAFIPVFEENGMIAEVDKHMWRCACEILARWKSVRDDLFISINISPKDFYFMKVDAELRAIVAEYGVDPSRLRIEITETVMMTDIENRVKILNDLRRSGFVVEIDDFGSGYSSLNMLKDMPVDVLKIDMMFLNKSNDDEKSRTILHNVIGMSEDLGISPLTEGVETQAQYRMLSDMGCHLFQGYYFAKPLPLDEFEKLYFSEASAENGEGEGTPSV